MRQRRIDEGLLLLGLFLIGIGAYALYHGEIFLGRITASEGQGMGGIGALIVGVLIIAAGLYFLFQARK